MVFENPYLVNGSMHRLRRFRTPAKIKFGSIGLVGALPLFLTLSCVRPPLFFVELLGQCVPSASKSKFQVRTAGGKSQNRFVADRRSAVTLQPASVRASSPCIRETDLSLRTTSCVSAPDANHVRPLKLPTLHRITRHRVKQADRNYRVKGLRHRIFLADAG